MEKIYITDEEEISNKRLGKQKKKIDKEYLELIKKINE